MSEFETMVVMYSAFAVIVLAAYACAQRLRERGYGPQLDALHDATRRVQVRILRYISIFLGATAARQQAPPQRHPEASLPPRYSGTKQE